MSSSIFFATVFAFLVALVASEGYGEHEVEETTITTTTEYVPKRKCYQCSYSPGKTVYTEKEFVKKIPDPTTGKYKIVREKKMVPEKQMGGWDKCRGPFSKYDADKFGVDTWECEHNCFVRVDKAGNLFRGCYRGEFGVDPHDMEVQEVGDSKYKFCEDELCNNFNIQEK